MSEIDNQGVAGMGGTGGIDLWGGMVFGHQT
jgi:hypothetical protein